MMPAGKNGATSMKYLSGILVAALVAGPAIAADMRVKAPLKAPPPAPVLSWTGCYVGGNAGGMIGADRYSLSMGGDFLLPGNIFSNPANSSLVNHSYTPNPGAFTGGVQIGCNYQSGVWVWGVEADINGASRMSTTTSFGPNGPFVGPGPGTLMASHTETITKDLDWYSTFRGRVGFTPTPNWLLYGTGGLAVAGIRSTTNLAFGADQFFLNSFNFAGSTTQTRVGFALGAGAEWGFAPRWSLKLEYLFLDFGTFSYAAACTNGCAPGSNFLFNNSVRAQEHVARVGINYKFY
jgi:outer membrane immunogenic protein